MCVAVPMRVRSIDGHRALLESLGVVTEADISLLDAVIPGDYVLIHAGFAVAKLAAEDAEETITLFRELRGLGA